MDHSQENEQTLNETQQIKDVLLSASVTFLKTIFYFIVLPYKIWKASTLRLASFKGKALIKENEEFPVFTFLKINYDATIFFMAVIIIIAPIIGLFFTYDRASGLFTAISVYFLIIPLLSLFKEGLLMMLDIVKSLEIIKENTRK